MYDMHFFDQLNKVQNGKQMLELILKLENRSQNSLGMWKPTSVMKEFFSIACGMDEEMGPYEGNFYIFPQFYEVEQTETRS